MPAGFPVRTSHCPHAPGSLQACPRRRSQYEACSHNRPTRRRVAGFQVRVSGPSPLNCLHSFPVRSASQMRSVLSQGPRRCACRLFTPSSAPRASAGFRRPDAKVITKKPATDACRRGPGDGVHPVLMSLERLQACPSRRITRCEALSARARHDARASVVSRQVQARLMSLERQACSRRCEVCCQKSSDTSASEVQATVITTRVCRLWSHRQARCPHSQPRSSSGWV